MHQLPKAVFPFFTFFVTKYFFASKLKWERNGAILDPIFNNENNYNARQDRHFETFLVDLKN
jgi:hypothetical protein